MFKKTLVKSLLVSTLIGSMAAISTPAMATSEAMLNLLKILRDKGSITSDEYEALKNAAEADGKEVEKIASEAKANVKEVTEKLSWAEKIKIKGDVRLRFQDDFDANTTSPKDRGRARVRARMGVIATPTDGVETGIGMASGGTDLRSTNQTLDSTFSTKGWNLDYAYAQWKPAQVNGLKLIGGKFYRKPWLWQTTDVYFDGDITFEGASANYSFKNSMGHTFVNAGLWTVDFNKAADDPRIYYGQLGHKFKSGDIFGTVAGTFMSLDGNRSELTTVATSNNSARAEFNEQYGLSGELGMHTNFFGQKTMIKAIADYWNNASATTNQDTAYAVGVKFGHSKVKNSGSWQVKYVYRDVQADSVIDQFPDSDAYDGNTGVFGHEVAAEYALYKNFILGVDYYAMQSKTAGARDKDLVQLDAVFKF